MEKLLLKGNYPKKIFKIQNKKIALLFWGLVRSSKWTYSSLKKNILEVLEKNKIEYKIFFHTYFLKDKYNNKRANEINIKIDNNDYKILKPDYFSYDWQEEELDKIKPSQYFPIKDPWSNNYNTFQNYVLALNSQKKVSEMFLNCREEFDYVIYLRPDVKFLNRFQPNWFNLCKINTILTPTFGNHGGLNDRYAMMLPNLISIYGYRFNYLKDKNILTSEKLLKKIIENNKIKNIHLNIKFQRVRATGKIDIRDHNISQ